MQHCRKKIALAAGLALLLVFAYCLRFVFHPLTDNALLGISMMTLRWVIHITLTLVWCASIKERILHTSIRRRLLTVGALLLFWQVIRIIKYDYVIITEPIGRYCWYGFYIPMVLVPVLGLFLVDHIGKPEDYRSPGWMNYLFVPALFLIAVVFTNDRHQLVFVFYEGFELYNSAYSYGFMYVIVMAWFIILSLTDVIMLLRKSRVPGSRSFQKLPLLVLLGAILFWTGYSLKLYQGDLTAMDCILIILLLESAIQCGLIPSNMNYRGMFQRSPQLVQIVDRSLEVRYRTGAGEPLDKALIQQALRGPVDLGDSILNSQPISGGHVLWQNDVKEINALAEHLRDTNEELGECYDLMKAEVELRERRIRAEEKSRLYDRIAQQIAPRLDKADQFLRCSREEPDRVDALLSQVCVICAYIKRRANLVLLGEKKEVIAARELESCLHESLDNLRLNQVLTFLDCRCEGQTTVSRIVTVYDFFEDVTELLLDRLSAMVVTLRCDGKTISLKIQVGVRADVPALPPLQIENGRVSCDVQDEDVIIEAVVPQEGGAV